MFFSLPLPALRILLQDAARRDLVTARRAALLTLLLMERHLSREQIITRLEYQLGSGCFGEKSWKDTFYRDLRVIKEALHSAGYVLKYSRSQTRIGYYLEGQPVVSPALAAQIRGAVDEADPLQIEIFKTLTPAQRFRLGCSVTNAGIRAAAFRLRQDNPALSPAQAQSQVMQGKLPQ
jgi:hypothetical protein